MSFDDKVKSFEEARKRRKQPVDDGRPLIRVVAGEKYREADEAEAALIKADDGLYCYGDQLVHIEWDFIRVAGGDSATALRLFEATAVNVRERMEKAARFEKWDAKAKDYVTCGCPKDVAETLLSRGSWGLPPLLGVVTAPTLRPNGTVIDKPGYDLATGIVFESNGVKFPSIPERPTREQAMKAILELQHLLRGFTFVTPADESVALSAILTAVVRRAMPVAPMHAFSAPMPGSGKSMLVDIASVIATGWRAAVMAADEDQYNSTELGKKITAALLMGYSIISIDNMEKPIGGGFVCQCLTEHILSLRILGLSKNVRTPNSALYFATGNNLTVINDATRRVLVAMLNPNVERPELRRFNFNAVKLALRARPILVAHALTIIRAFLVSSEKVDCPPLGSYEVWSRFVRHPLVWLGKADPASVMEKVRADDPQLGKTRSVVSAWWSVLGDKEVRVRDAIQTAGEMEREDFGEGYRHPELRDALRGVAEGRGREDLSPDRLGWWLKRHVNTIVVVDGAGFRFMQAGGAAGHRVAWRLERVG